MTVHAAYAGSPVTVGEELVERGWKVVDPTEFLKVPKKDRCRKCDFTAS